MPDLQTLPLARPVSAASATMLQLMGSPRLRWQGRSNAPWAYAKLPALLTVLGDAWPQPVHRDWLAALLWPDGDAGSLRRALYDLRRQLRTGAERSSLLSSSHQALWLGERLPVDVALIDRAWRGLRAGRLQAQHAEAAVAVWQGEFAAGLVVDEADDFALWLMQARARWEQRALQVAQGLAEWHLRASRAESALAVASLAVERVPDAESARAIVWRCQVAAGARLQAVHDWRRFQDLLAAQGLAPSAALRDIAAGLGLPTPPSSKPAFAEIDDGAEALADSLGCVLRGGAHSGAEIESLLDMALKLLQQGKPGSPSAARVLLLRRATMLRLLHAPWEAAMLPLVKFAERLLCHALDPADQLNLVQTLATWHGWMGRGVRGEVLLRTLTDVAEAASLAPAVHVRWQMTLALCHSCSTGDPERSIRAARRGLKVAQAGAVPGATPILQMLVANAALNRGAPGDARRASLALERALADGPLRRFDLVNHLQLAAHWQLLHGAPAQALAVAEQGAAMARAVPFPLQGLSCTLLGVSARLLLGETSALAFTLQDAVALARRIGSQGYLMNALYLAAVVQGRLANGAAATAALAEADAIALACGVQRVRKIPPALLAEARAAGPSASG